MKSAWPTTPIIAPTTLLGISGAFAMLFNYYKTLTRTNWSSLILEPV